MFATHELRRFVGSTTQLLDHLSRCETCQEDGTGHCAQVRELAAVVRADRARDVDVTCGECGVEIRKDHNDVWYHDESNRGHQAAPVEADPRNRP